MLPKQIQHVPILCYTMGVPVCALSGLSAKLAPVLGGRSVVAVAFKKPKVQYTMGVSLADVVCIVGFCVFGRRSKGTGKPCLILLVS